VSKGTAKKVATKMPCCMGTPKLIR
jgi:hypothetical protein